MPHVDRPGVLTATQVLSVTVPKPALLPWAVKCSAEDLAAQLAKRGVKVTDAEVRSAKKAHTRQSERARDIGSCVHAMIDESLKRLKAGDTSGEQTSPPKEWAKLDAEAKQTALSKYGSWLSWWLTCGLEIIDIERDLYAEGALLAGSCDLIARCPDGCRAVVDWKTSSGIYSDSWYQLGIYAHLLRLAGEPVGRLMVVRLGMGGEVEVRSSDRVHAAEEAARALFESARILTREKDPWAPIRK